MKAWLRADALSPRHPKIIGLPSDAVRWTWFLVLCEAKIASPQGSFHDKHHLRGCLPGRPAAHIEALLHAELLDLHEDGSITVHDWEDWQSGCPSDPTSAERQRRHRQRVTAARNGDVTALRHGQTETETETETDTETERTKPPLPPAPPVPAPPSPGFFASLTPEAKTGFDLLLGRLRAKYPQPYPRIESWLRSWLFCNPPPDVVLKALRSLADHDAQDPIAYLRKIRAVDEPSAYAEQHAAANEGYKHEPSHIGNVLGQLAARGGKA